MNAFMIENCYVLPTLTALCDINVGDTVLVNGQLRTVGRDDIYHDSFMGTTIFGNSYHIKRKIIKCKIFNGLRFN
ncbi:hypothetical protein VmeM32_00179 [Vibrio phage vB_VmeM-32]|nr:hypothetical protein VmeM32_00179 [Vibrio phage vB_VmeM-32]